jgi:hypothetical protein
VLSRKRVTALLPRLSSTFIAARGNSYISFGAIGWPPFIARISCSLVAGIAAVGQRGHIGQHAGPEVGNDAAVGEAGLAIGHREGR